MNGSLRTVKAGKLIRGLKSRKYIQKISPWITMILLMIMTTLPLQTPPTFAMPDTEQKTVEYFIYQGLDQYASATDRNTSFTIDLPENGITIRSAIVQVRLNETATVTAGTIEVTGSGATTTTTTLGTMAANSNESFPQVYYHNATDSLSSVFANNQTMQSKTFNLRTNFTGSTRSVESAKIIITYEYDNTSQYQLKTIRQRIDQRTADLAINTDANFSLAALGLPENSVTVKDGWAEIRGTIPGTATTDEAFSMNWDSEAAQTGAGMDMVKTTNTDFFIMTHGHIDPTAAHTLYFQATAGYSMSVVGAELVFTYQYDHLATTTVRKTIRYALGQDTTAAAAVANTYDTGNVTFNIPESPTLKNIYVKVYGLNALTSTISVGVNGGAKTAYTVTFGGEQSSGYWIMHPTGTSIVQGDNTISVQVQSSAASCASRNVELIVTYEFPVSVGYINTQKTVEYFVHESTASVAANTDINAAFTIYIPEASPTTQSSYIETNNCNAGTAANTLTHYVDAGTSQGVPFNNTGENTHQFTRYNLLSFGSGAHTAHVRSSTAATFAVKAVITYKSSVYWVPTLGWPLLILLILFIGYMLVRRRILKLRRVEA